MPLVEMYSAKGELTNKKKADLSRKVTDLLVKETRAPQHHTWVIIHELPEANWMIDRLTLPKLFAELKAERARALPLEHARVANDENVFRSNCPRSLGKDLIDEQNECDICWFDAER